MISLKLNERRESAAVECSNCPRCDELATGSVMCKWTGTPLRIPLSVGKCPDDRWDHSAPIGNYKSSVKSDSVLSRPGQPLDGINPIQRERWPLTILEFAEERTDGEAGVGDTLSRIGGDVQNQKDAFALSVLLSIAKGVACKARVRAANMMYPYRSGEAE